MKRLTAIFIPMVMAISTWGATPLRLSTLYMDTPMEIRDSTVTFTINPEAQTLAIEARGSVVEGAALLAESSNSWGLEWGDLPTEGYRATLRRVCGPFSEPVLKIEITHTSNGIPDRPVDSITLDEGVNANSSEYNSMEIEIDRGSGRTIVSVGDRQLMKVVDQILQYPFPIDRWGISSTGKARIESAVIETGIDRSPEYESGWTEKSLADHFRESDDPVEGFWEYLDRENDETLARPGGRYRIATVKNGSRYDIVYIDGAEVNSDSWREGMYRGKLKPTRFVDQYDLEWIDSSFESITTDIHAAIEQGVILSLHFPLYKTTIRFSKVSHRDG